MRTALAFTLVIGLAANGGCADRRTAMGLGIAAAAALTYSAAKVATSSDYCNNSFGGEWGAKHSCGPEIIAGFSAGIILGLAAVVVWAQANHKDESVEALEAKGRVQRTRFLGDQAHDAARRGDCTQARDKANRIASIDPRAVRSLVLSDPLVRGCLGPATNRAP